MLQEQQHTVTSMDAPVDDLELEPTTPDVDNWLDDGAPRPTCEWHDELCDNQAVAYVDCICDDPECKADHRSWYCLRHYGLVLAIKLDHIRVCPGYTHDEACEENRVVTLEHIAGFGRIDQ